MIWITNNNQTIYDLAIQLYGDVSFAQKIALDNNLNFDYQSNTGDQIQFELGDTTTNNTQLLLVNNNKIIATGFKTQTPSLPTVLQRSFNNDFSFDFD